jgi:hypothetical protein
VGMGEFGGFVTEEELVETIIQEIPQYQRMGTGIRQSLANTFRHMVEEGEFESIESLSERGEIIKILNIIFRPYYYEMEPQLGRVPLEDRPYLIIHAESLYHHFKRYNESLKDKVKKGTGLTILEWDFWFMLRDQFDKAKQARPRKSYDKNQYRHYLKQIFNLYEMTELKEMENSLSKLFPDWYAELTSR